MRITRVQKFRKLRRKKTGNILLFAVLLPFSVILMGYIISAMVVLPTMGK